MNKSIIKTYADVPEAQIRLTNVILLSSLLMTMWKKKKNIYGVDIFLHNFSLLFDIEGRFMENLKTHVKKEIKKLVF